MHALPSRIQTSRLPAALRSVVALDLRSLALFRMAMALIVLHDLADRAADLVTMYSDLGIVPRAAVREFFGERSWWSFHMLGGEPWFVGLLFVVAALLGVALLLGWQTRAATFFLWLLLSSLHVRAPLVGNGGDLLLRMLMLWSVFLPLGRMWSLDARRARSAAGEDTTLVSIGGTALLAQMFLVYFMSGLFKCNPHWLSGEALYYALSFEVYGRPLGAVLRQYPEMLALLTRATLVMELVAPWLLLVPWRNHMFRLAVMAAFLGLHLGIELTISVGLFSYVCAAGWLALVPNRFWEWRVGRAIAVPFTKLFGPPAGDCTKGAEQQSLGARIRDRLELCGQGICLGLLLLMLAGNMENLNFFERGTVLPAAGQELTRRLNMHQKWAMFAGPLKNNFWFVARARLADGSSIDLLRRGEPIPETPVPGDVGDLPNHRWRKYFLNLKNDRYAVFREPLAHWLMERWNAAEPEERRVVQLDLVLIEQQIDYASRQGEYTARVLARIGEEQHEEAGNFAEALRRLEADGGGLDPFP